jgi:DNA-binding response OmpR family regulator
VVADAGDDDEWLVAGAVQMSVSTGEVWRGSRRVQLTDGQREVLRLLLTDGDQGLTAAEVLAAAGRSPDEGPGAADRLIAQLVRRVGLSSGDGEGVRTERTHVYYLDRLE